MKCRTTSTLHKRFPGSRLVVVLRKLIVPVAVALPLGVLPAAQAGARIPTPAPQPGADRPGSLVIVGGGGMPDSIWNRYMELAGGKKARIVIIPTAGVEFTTPQASRSYRFWKSLDVASVQWLHTRSRKVADDPAFARPLATATAVWLSGGDQSLLTDVYGGTAVERGMQSLLARGGVIGGSSAGAAVMGPLMIRGGTVQAEVGPGFGLLPGIVIDQHFMNRKRQGRLLGVLTRYPAYVGIGIDEATAIVVTGHRFTVLGDANVRVCFPSDDRSSVRVLKSGDREDLFALRQALVAHTPHHPAGPSSTPAREHKPAPEPEEKRETVKAAH